MVRVGGASTRLGTPRSAGATTMLMPATAAPSTTGAQAVIESQEAVVWCAGQGESSGVAERMDPSIDISL